MKWRTRRCFPSCPLSREILSPFPPLGFSMGCRVANLLSTKEDRGLLWFPSSFWLKSNSFPCRRRETGSTRTSPQDRAIEIPAWKRNGKLM
ncbi:unnamed protein product [Victoria cruziana]